MKYLDPSTLKILAAGLMLGVSVLGNAQDAPVSELSDSPLYQGEQLFQGGSFVAAVEVFKQAQGLDLEEGIVGASRSYAMMGNYAEAITVCEDALAGSDYADLPLLSTQLAEVKRMVGESGTALAILKAVIDGSLDAPVRTLVQYGSLLKFTGQRNLAILPLEQAIQRYNDGLVFASEDVAMVALANWLLSRFHDANSLFSEAIRANPNNLEAHVLWGDLFLEKFNNADAERSYQDVLDINSRYVPALVGITRAGGGDERTIQRALAINPSYVPAIETYAVTLLRNNRKQEAQEFFAQALAVNPEALGVLSALAAEALMFERDAEYQQWLTQVNTFSPGNAEFLGNIAENYGNNYRFTEAAGFARAAIAADPTYWEGYELLGSNLIRLGEEEEGKLNLEISYENDPFNVMTSNMLKVFDTLSTYQTRESEHFKVHMSQHDADVLWPYLEPLLEEAWTTLTAKYNFEPEVPVLIEIFENSEDFAVRSVGLPDIGPLVGICFGKVITLISPDTLSANWQEIVWHEFMHVITLQMTNNRMPRWLSEGISMWAEHDSRPYWGRRQGLDLVRAVKQDKLLHTANLNAGFSGAQSSADLGFAYFQSYLVVDYIAEEYGLEKMRELILQYAEIKEENDIFIAVFDESLESFDAGFKAWTNRIVEEINVFVHQEDLPDEGDGHGHGIRENSSAILAELYNNQSLKQHMQQRIQAEPRDFQAYLQMGIVLFKEEAFEEAKIYLEEAHKLLPDYTGYPSPPLVLSQIYEKEGDRAAQLAQLEILMQNQQHDYDSAMILARSAVEVKDFAKAEYFLGRAMEIDPYDIEVHRLRAQYAELTDDLQLAVTEHEVLVKLDFTDPVEAQTDLAEAYLRNGQTGEAKQNSLSALEIAPSYQRAQQILLQSIDSSN